MFVPDPGGGGIWPDLGKIITRNGSGKVIGGC
jgi:hypothetical protein